MAASGLKDDGYYTPISVEDGDKQTGVNIVPAPELEGNDHETMNRATLLQSTPNDMVRKGYDAEHEQLVRKIYRKLHEWSRSHLSNI